MVRSIGLVMLLAAVLGGCASAPSTSGASAANSSASPVATQAVAAVAPATTPTAAAPAPVSGAAVAGKPELVAAEKVPSGYKAIERDGQVLYCQSMTPLGTRFPKQVCMTPSEYKDSVNRRDQMREELTGKQKSYSTTR
jgi:hypothetical protein